MPTKRKKVDFDNLKRVACRNRLKILDMVYNAGSGHLGGSLSACDIITYLGECIIDYRLPERSRFILSKGHSVPALYAELNELGIIRDDELETFRQVGSRLSGHTNRVKIPESEITTGLLGEGLSFGVGMAFGKRLKGSKEQVFVMIGDGETHEGQIWEAMMEAGHYKLDNLVLIIDRNGLCSHQPVENVISIEPLKERLESFGWFVKDINGHSMEEIDSAITSLESQFGKPKCIIAHTVKGKGISFMENDGQWHRSIPNKEQYIMAREELSEQLRDLS